VVVVDGGGRWSVFEDGGRDQVVEGGGGGGGNNIGDVHDLLTPHSL